MITGADEAGRGCIIGPLVICCASINQLEEFRLKELGVKDSKKLSARRREELTCDIEKLCRLTVIKISAVELNELMDRHSLNEIEAMKIAEAVNISEIEEGSTLYVDSPDNYPSKFAKRIEKYLTKKMKLVSENYAEDKYLCVAAASVIAKVTRDREIERIKEIVGHDFHSGYTSDPITINYLKHHVEDEKLQPFLRKKWKTLLNIKQKRLSEY